MTRYSCLDIWCPTKMAQNFHNMKNKGDRLVYYDASSVIGKDTTEFLGTFLSYSTKPLKIQMEFWKRKIFIPPTLDLASPNAKRPVLEKNTYTWIPRSLIYNANSNESPTSIQVSHKIFKGERFYENMFKWFWNAKKNWN